jgi:hypothetical protein
MRDSAGYAVSFVPGVPGFLFVLLFFQIAQRKVKQKMPPHCRGIILISERLLTFGVIREGFL